MIGCDFAGTVIAIHQDTKTNIQMGDRVCSVVHGSNPGDPTNGAFAECVRARPELLLRVPKWMPMQQAAALGTGLATNSLALWTGLSLNPSPDAIAEKPFPVLVYGGSTSTGTLAIQLLKLSGLDPIATCSPKNFSLVRGYGASAVFDYNDPQVAQKIKEYTSGRLRHAYDCITDRESVPCCYAALGRTGGRYVCLELCPEELQTRKAVRAETVFCYEIFGVEAKLSGGYERPADERKYEETVRWLAIFQNLIDEGKLKTHPIQKLDSGLHNVIRGLQLLKSGAVSGKKLVVPILETRT